MALAIALSLFGCNRRDPVLLGGEGVSRFHERYNAGDFDSIFRSGSESYRRSIGIRDHNDVLAQQLELREKVVRAKKVNAIVRRQRGTSVVALTYDTVFSKGPATEYFAFAVAPFDQGPQLITYEVESVIRRP